MAKTTKFQKVMYATEELKTIEWRVKDSDTETTFLRKGAPAITGPEILFQQFKPLFQNLLHERFVVFILNSANKVNAYKIVTEGILNSCLVHPREVFSPAILGHAASIIIAHNHPSENPEPSSEDINITRQLNEAGKILGIPLCDHIIFAGDKYTSLADRGIL